MERNRYRREKIMQMKINVLKKSENELKIEIEGTSHGTM